MDDIELAFLEAEEKMQNALNVYKNKLSRINTGRANPMIIHIKIISLYVLFYFLKLLKLHLLC
jgi:ribosome recycling factor